MKKNIKIYSNGKYVNKEINHIPLRFISAIFLTLLEVALIIGIMVVLTLYVPYFYILILLTEIGTIIAIVTSNNNPDYKLIWLFVVVILPIIGLMLYFIFHKRKLPQKIIKRLHKLNDSYTYLDLNNFKELENKNKLIKSQAECICKTAKTHLYKNTKLTYFSSGEQMHISMLESLKTANKFIFLEYFIIKEGYFWNSILEILIDKAKKGVEVRLVFDDIGCMGTLPGNYHKILTKKYNIQTVPFSKLKGQADGEFNNRSHRKIMVIDGQIGYTGGINIADEYINKTSRFGHWKDNGIKLEGEAVNELTKLFITDFYLNVKKFDAINYEKYYIAKPVCDNNNFVVPFGDAPKPINNAPIGQMAIINLLNQAKQYVYITTPYLIVDHELMQALKTTAIRGVDIRIIVPHIPDKRLVFGMTKSNYKELIKYGVKIYEYTPGFIHAKSYISDDEYGIIGTINLDYRSLTHHFENGVWIYNDNIILDIKNDFVATMKKSQYMNGVKQKENILTKFVNILVRIFSPLL